jgi:hypothetical protein
MPSPGIVEALDVIEYIGLGLRSRAVQLCSRALRLQRREKALHHRIVPDVAQDKSVPRHCVYRKTLTLRLDGPKAPRLIALASF